MALPRVKPTTAILIAAAILAAVPVDAFAAACRPKRPKPPVVATSMGPCAFDRERLSFGGTAEEQARCLMRPVGLRAKLGPVPDALPPVFAARIGGDTALPSRAALTIVLTEDGLRETFGPALLWPVSRALDADPFAPAARYLVLHDTSGPYLRRFPGDLDSHRRLNNLARFRCSDGWELAHVVINRPGEVFVGHDFSEPWRATKFERAVNFGTDLKGLFLHVELLQPRRGRGGTIAPTPGFTSAQYDRLALTYVVASVRAGHWLIPATHAAIDNHVKNGHDDPQNFDFLEFARSLERLTARLHKAEEPVIAGEPASPAIDETPAGAGALAASPPPPNGPAEHVPTAPAGDDIDGAAAGDTAGSGRKDE